MEFIKNTTQHSTEAETKSIQCSVKPSEKQERRVNLDFGETSEEALFVLKEPSLSAQPPRKKRKQMMPLSSKQRDSKMSNCNKNDERKYNLENNSQFEESQHLNSLQSEPHKTSDHSESSIAFPGLNQEDQMSQLMSTSRDKLNIYSENNDFGMKINGVQDEDNTIVDPCKTSSNGNIVQLHLQSADVAKSKIKLLIVELDMVISQHELELQKLYSRKAKALRKLKNQKEKVNKKNNMMNGDCLKVMTDLTNDDNEEPTTLFPPPAHNNKEICPLLRDKPDVSKIKRSKSVARLLKDKKTKPSKTLKDAAIPPEPSSDQPKYTAKQEEQKTAYPELNGGKFLKETNKCIQPDPETTTKPVEINDVMEAGEIRSKLRCCAAQQSTTKSDKSVYNSHQVPQQYTGSTLHYHGDVANVVTNNHSNAGTGAPNTYNKSPKSNSLPEAAGNGNSLIPVVLFPAAQTMSSTGPNNNMHTPGPPQITVPVTTAQHQNSDPLINKSHPFVIYKHPDEIRHPTEQLNQMQKLLIQPQPADQMKNMRLMYGMSVCSLCNKPSQFVCAACKKVWYCSKECQVIHSIIK